jgi:NAD-dependent dihydropyrimidine dehydrogenase PreA subunit
MAYVISDDCTTCGACIDECPVEAISEGDTKYSIDPDTCTDCGICADTCPVEAISPA